MLRPLHSFEVPSRELAAGAQQVLDRLGIAAVPPVALDCHQQHVLREAPARGEGPGPIVPVKQLSDPQRAIRVGTSQYQLVAVEGRVGWLLHEKPKHVECVLDIPIYKGVHYGEFHVPREF